MLVALCVLGSIVCALCYAAWSIDDRGVLRVSFLDVGQGDSIFIQSPSGVQVLIDGGRGSTVLRRLSSEMHWWDRSIDMVVATHPDADHIGGLIDVLARYRVAMTLHSSVEGDTPEAEALIDSIQQEGAQDITALRGQRFELGDGAYLLILFPDRPVQHVATNDGSIVAKLVYGDTAFMLTGDAPQGVEDYLVMLDGLALHADVLKAGHHGSGSSSGTLFLGYVSPEYGVFSRGCDNSYGHPAPETVERFKRFAIPTVDTCTDGTVTFVSDGNMIVRE